MKTNRLTEPGSGRLRKGGNNVKLRKIIDAAMIGFCLGVMIYSANKNGFSLFTFFPLMTIYLIVRNSGSRSDERQGRNG